MSKSIIILGARGHFGRIIFEAIYKELPELQLHVLGRTDHKSFNRSRVNYHSFDLTKAQSLPEFIEPPLLLLDLTGPCKAEGGIAQNLALSKGIIYMDMALHNSHLEQVNKISRQFSSGISIIHTGLFPGFSNLIVKEIIKKSTSNTQIQLLSSFPVYAGGGKNVSRSLIDILEESQDHFYRQSGKRHFFRMHSIYKHLPFFGKKKVFYRWELPEIRCFEKSFPSLSLERWIALSPSIFNVVFKWATWIYSQQKITGIVSLLLRNMVYFSKNKLFRQMNPTVRIEGRNDSEREFIRIRLEAKNAISLHGRVMVNFVKTLLQKNLNPGVYTPEEVFEMNEILPEGIHKEYSLEVYTSNQSKQTFE